MTDYRGIGGYFCHSQDDRKTPLFESMEDAIHEAQKEKMAPFVIYQMVAQPVGQRLTNGPDARLVGRAFVVPTLTKDQVEAIKELPTSYEIIPGHDQG